MKDKGWDTLIMSDPDHEHLVAELNYDGRFLALLDRDEGRNSVRIGFPDAKGKILTRVGLDEFIDVLRKAAEDLRA
jgi:hypothetical protein